MLNFIQNFARDEDGAVTVDWVVLTAAIVGLGIAVLTSVRGGAVDMAEGIETQLGTAVSDDFFRPRKLNLTYRSPCIRYRWAAPKGAAHSRIKT